MGEIAKIRGMKISIYPFSDNGNEHPPAHIHVNKNRHRYKFDINTYEPIYDSAHNKKMPKNDQKALIKWMKEHHEELIENWKIAESKSSNFKYIN